MVCDSVRSSVTTSPAAANRPTDRIFCPKNEASRDSAMRGVPLHVYYIHVSQYAHPMGSGRLQWTAGENMYTMHEALDLTSYRNCARNTLHSFYNKQINMMRYRFFRVYTLMNYF